MRTSNKIIFAVLFLGVFIQFLFQLSFSNFIFQPDYLDKPTGFASTSAHGNVSLLISSELSLVLDDSDIDFLACRPNSTIFSNVLDGSTNADCPGFVPDEIIVRNDGSINANVTIGFSNWGEAHNGSFINSSSNDSFVSYLISNLAENSPYNGGCNGSFQSSWTNVTDSYNSNILGCDNLSAHFSDNSFEFDISFFIPESAFSGSNELTVTFTANNVI